MKLSVAEKTTIITTLLQAFEDDDCVNYVVKQDVNRLKRITLLIKYSLKITELSGRLYKTSNNEAVILALGSKTASLRVLFWEILIACNCVGIRNLKKATQRENKIRRQHPKNRIYLWYIGVLPKEQNKGLGSKLMLEIIADSEQKKTPIYLETTLEKNVAFYHKFGFEIYKTLKFRKTLYLMKREIQNNQ